MKGLAVAGAAAFAVLAIGGACVDSGVDSYDEFRSALEKGASCSELFDQRAKLGGKVDRDWIDRDLREIGCDDRDSDRNDL